MSADTEFLREQQRAIERMREMSRRSTADSAHAMPPAPSFVRVNSGTSQGKNMQENAYFPAQEERSEKPTVPSKEQHRSAGKARSGGGFPSFDLPFSDMLGVEPDIALILGLLLLLWSEKAEKRLLLALLYIIF